MRKRKNHPVCGIVRGAAAGRVRGGAAQQHGGGVPLPCRSVRRPDADAHAIPHAAAPPTGTALSRRRTAA